MGHVLDGASGAYSSFTPILPQQRDRARLANTFSRAIRFLEHARMQSESHDYQNPGITPFAPVFASLYGSLTLDQYDANSSYIFD